MSAIGSLAERIEIALDSRMLSIDYTEEQEADREEIRRRYSELKSTRSFSESAKIARTEFVQQVITEFLLRHGVEGL